jgi:hypothetical protein
VESVYLLVLVDVLSFDMIILRGVVAAEAPDSSSGRSLAPENVKIEVGTY